LPDNIARLLKLRPLSAEYTKENAAAIKKTRRGISMGVPGKASLPSNSLITNNAAAVNKMKVIIRLIVSYVDGARDKS